MMIMMESFICIKLTEIKRTVILCMSYSINGLYDFIAYIVQWKKFIMTLDILLPS